MKRTNAATTPKDDIEATESDIKGVCYTALIVFAAVLLTLIGGIYFLM